MADLNTLAQGWLVIQGQVMSRKVCKLFFYQIKFSYFCISVWNLGLTRSWFLTIAQFCTQEPFHLAYNSQVRKQSNLSKAFSLGKAPCFITLRKLEWILSTAFVVYIILRIACHSQTVEQRIQNFSLIHLLLPDTSPRLA